MGTFRYGQVEQRVEDADLAHLRAVARAMLVSAEPFLLTFASDDASQLAIWVTRGTSMRFDFDEHVRQDDVDPWHVDLMTACANSCDGLTIGVPQLA